MQMCRAHPRGRKLGQRPAGSGMQARIISAADTYATTHAETADDSPRTSIPALPELGQPDGREWRVLYVPAKIHLVQ